MSIGASLIPRANAGLLARRLGYRAPTPLAPNTDSPRKRRSDPRGVHGRTRPHASARSSRGVVVPLGAALVFASGVGGRVHHEYAAYEDCDGKECAHVGLRRAGSQRSILWDPRRRFHKTLLCEQGYQNQRAFDGERPLRRAQLVRLSDALGVAFLDTIEQALDALEARLKGTR